MDDLNANIRKLLVTIGCPAHVLREPHRGPDRFKLLRWLYLRFQEIPDNGEKATIVTEERLKEWVGLMGVPKLATNADQLDTFVSMKKQVAREDSQYLLQLVETIKAYNNGISTQTDSALMDLLASNVQDVFSSECTLFPPDITDFISRETNKADLIDSKGKYKYEDLEGLKNTLHEMKLKTVKLEKKIEKVKKGNLVKLPPTNEIKNVIELNSGVLQDKMKILKRNIEEFENWQVPVGTNKYENKSIQFSALGPTFQKSNKDMESVLTLLSNLKNIREVMDSLTYYSSSTNEEDIATA